MDTHTIPGITPAQFQLIQLAASKNGFTMGTFKGGPVEHMGCKVWWEWPWHPGAPAADLTIKIDAPPFVGGIAYRIIKDSIDSAIHPSPVPGAITP